MFLQVGCGLVAAHGLGLVHRDFKLASVVIDGDGRARMPDFGPVRRSEPPGADGVPTARRRARRGASRTPAYMAPEQRAGLAADVLSDQFSFCVALHEALVGARPDAAAAPGRRRDPDAARPGDQARPRRRSGRALAVDAPPALRAGAAAPAGRPGQPRRDRRDGDGGRGRGPGPGQLAVPGALTAGWRAARRRAIRSAASAARRRPRRARSPW